MKAYQNCFEYNSSSCFQPYAFHFGSCEAFPVYLEPVCQNPGHHCRNQKKMYILSGVWNILTCLDAVPLGWPCEALDLVDALGVALFLGAGPCTSFPSPGPVDLVTLALVLALCTTQAIFTPSEWLFCCVMDSWHQIRGLLLRGSTLGFEMPAAACVLMPDMVGFWSWGGVEQLFMLVLVGEVKK